jgi:hypothetical protein
MEVAGIKPPLEEVLQICYKKTSSCILSSSYKILYTMHLDEVYILEEIWLESGMLYIQS